MKEEKQGIGEENKQVQKNENSKKEINQISETKTKKENTKKTRKAMIPIILITVFICALMLLSVIFALININNDTILSGISIMGVDISNLTPEEAIRKMQEIIQTKESNDITLKYQDYETTINGKQINVKYDIENAVTEAYNTNS